VKLKESFGRLVDRNKFIKQRTTTNSHLTGEGNTFTPSSWNSFLDQIAVRLRPPVSEELPHLADLLNFIEIQIRDDHFFFVA
jgi:hypothetical protein